MLLATHALVGAALGKNIGSPWLIAALAIPLHFFLDHFRHGEYLDRNSKIKDTWWKTAIDLLAGLMIVAACIFFFQPSAAIVQSMSIGIFFSILPDFSTLLYCKFNFTFLKKVREFHAYCHKYPSFSKEREFNIRNGANDILFSIVAIVLLFL